MSFFEAVKNSFLKTFTFKGRARRAEHWKFILFCIITAFILTIVDTKFSIKLFEIKNNSKYYAIGTCNIFGFIMAFPLFSSTWRRLHDIGKPGWLRFIFIPFEMCCLLLWIFGHFSEMEEIVEGIALIDTVYQLTFVLVWRCKDGNPYRNQYGDDPKGRNNGGLPIESEIYHCPECGSKIRNGSNSCAICGYEMSELPTSVRYKDSNPYEVSPDKNSACYCTECGTQISNGSKFCANCGCEVTASPKSSKTTLKDAKTYERNLFRNILLISVCIALAISLFMLHNSNKETDQYRQENNELTDENRDLEKKLSTAEGKATIYDSLMKYVDFNNFFLGGRFAPSDYVFVMSAGEVMKFTLYTKFPSDVSIKTENHGSAATVDFTENNWDDETKMKITAKSRGVTTVDFTNDVNDASFNIVIIVM